MPTWIFDPSIRVLVFGLGYSGAAIARAVAGAGFAVCGTVRDAGALTIDGIHRFDFAQAGSAIAQATHVVSTVPPDASGDPVLGLYADALHAAPTLRWIGYLSTTGVYGDRGGGWVDETTPPAPASDRSRRRVAAEDAWQRLADRRAVDVFRLAGIYGPGRSAFDELRAASARRIDRPGHCFGRIHRDDIAQAVLAAMRQAGGPSARIADPVMAGEGPPSTNSRATKQQDVDGRSKGGVDDEYAAAGLERAPTGLRIFNLADDGPSPSADVVTEAAQLLGVAPPALVPYTEAERTMSPMARSFWAENRKVSSARTQQVLGLRWHYPSYREGLRAILAEERGERPA